MNRASASNDGLEFEWPFCVAGVSEHQCATGKKCEPE